jgi:hypothetical protein
MLQGTSTDEMGPQHIAPVVLWLASDLAHDVNGRIMGVHGSKVFEYKMTQSEGLAAPPEGGAWTPELLSKHLGGFECA